MAVVFRGDVLTSFTARLSVLGRVLLVPLESGIQPLFGSRVLGYMLSKFRNPSLIGCSAIGIVSNRT